MTFGSYPPSPDLVETREAARIFGCSVSNFLRVMREYQVEAVRTYQGRRHVRSWHPVVVLQIRRAHAMNRKRRPVQYMTNANRSSVEAGRLKRRHTFLENRRQIILARIKARESCSST